jgi:hypothetical protein
MFPVKKRLRGLSKPGRALGYLEGFANTFYENHYFPLLQNLSRGGK